VLQQASKRQVKPAKAAEARKRDAGAAGAGVNGGPAVKKPWWACGCMSSSDAESPKAAAAANMAPAPELPPVMTVRVNSSLLHPVYDCVLCRRLVIPTDLTGRMAATRRLLITLTPTSVPIPPITCLRYSCCCGS